LSPELDLPRQGDLFGQVPASAPARKTQAAAEPSVSENTALHASLGLQPQETWVVGPGFSREELKDLWLATGRGFVAQAIVGLSDLAIQVLNQERRLNRTPRMAKGALLRPSSRQEIIDRLLSDPRIREHFPELRRLKRQIGAIRRIDKALQGGRLSFAHAEERIVLEERLKEKGIENPLGRELAGFAAAYEAFLMSKDLWDEPLLYQEAARVVRTLDVQKPNRLVFLRAAQVQSRELDLIEAFRQAGTEIVFQGPEAKENRATLSWERWHTWDDACERIGDGIDPVHDAVLMADSPDVRRSLMRALEDRGIQLEDPRDPTALRASEAIKRALLPLRLVAAGFDRADVIEWCLRPASSLEREQRAEDVSKLESYGFRRGLEAIRRMGLERLAVELEHLSVEFAGRLTVAELGRKHLKILRRENAPDIQAWLAFFERQWTEFADDVRRTERDRRAPVLHWLSRFEERLSEAKPPPLAVKAKGGLRVFRFSMAPVPGDARPIRKLWVVGMNARWLDEEGEGDLWFSERDRLALGTEFAVRSAAWRREERLAILRSWMSRAQEVQWLDASYQYDGKETEGLKPILLQLFEEVPAAPADCGGHTRFMPSFGALGWIPAQEFQVKPLPEGAEVSATAIDSFSRCEFLGVAQGRWRLRDLREADLEMWGSAFGNLLHLAVKRMVEGLGIDAAIEEAWKAKPPQGMIRSPRLEKMARARMRQILESFSETEAKFRSQAGTRTLSLEGPLLQVRAGGLVIRGTPDRVEEHPEGLFLIDYKTAAQNFGAREMMEQGYGLQLAIYGLGLRNSLRREVIGAQFVELSKKVTRSRGLLFEKWNGKEPGKLHQSRAKNHLRPEAPDEVWSRMEGEVARHAEGFRSGLVRTQPKRPLKDCPSCNQKDVCGRRRAEAAGISSIEEGEA
jgi:hypothetical protein